MHKCLIWLKYNYYYFKKPWMESYIKTWQFALVVSSPSNAINLINKLIRKENNRRNKIWVEAYIIEGGSSFLKKYIKLGIKVNMCSE
jgi:hypothetical protein